MPTDPKPLSDFVQTNVVAGFLVFYGDFLGRRDAWAVHEWIGPIIIGFGLFLYGWNWWWGWHKLSTKTRIAKVWRSARIVLCVTYVIAGLAVADAFVHWHHEAAPERKTSRGS